MLQLTDPLSIFTPPFPLPFTGVDDGEIWTCKNYLLLIEVCPQGVAMPEDMPSFRFEYAAHLYNMAVPTSRPMATYTLEQICFSEDLANRLLKEKKGQYFHTDGCYLGPFFFTRYLPGEHKNYGGVAFPDHVFTSEDKDLFNGTVATSIYRELEFAEGEVFRYAGNSNAFWELRADFDKSRENDK